MSLTDGNTLSWKTNASLETGNHYMTNWTVVVNNTMTVDKREFHIVLTGKNLTGVKGHKVNNKIVVSAHRCIGSCLETIEEVETENDTRRWSDAANWPNGVMPQAGEDVFVESGWNMTFDMADTPIYRVVVINGILNFKNDTDLHLKAKHIFVRAGELNIGTEANPHEMKATITLYGERASESMVYNAAIYAGNKVIANVGTIKLFGKPRTKVVTRLFASAVKGAKLVFVEPSLDLVAGDRLALAPSSYDNLAADEFFVEAYNNVTGEVKVNTT